ncbi:MAG: glutamyl-tRNA reductase [Anaerolineales bacterium]|nr:glutamyl-tRNA reductase [Anaerolineales bacterium]
MYILCVGINHATAPLHIRERFAFDSEFKPTLNESLAGLIVLSTCNRVELYATANIKDFSGLDELLAKHGGVDQRELSQYIYRHTDDAAAGHLMQVAAGLDSVVLGEPQILGQITRALETALAENTSAPLLARLFQKAIHAGKRVRSETGIARNPTSIAGVAVRLASENLPHLPSMQVTVLGAGETASLVVGALRQRGVENLQVLNRTLRHAEELASFWGGSARPLSDLPVALQSSDLVVSSVQSPQPIVQTQTVASAMQVRPQRALTLIDVAVPRNVEPEAAHIPNVFLHNIDNLQTYLKRSVDSRQQEQPHAEKIINEELNEFRDYLRTYQILPVITALYDRAESIRVNEVKKSIKRMTSLDEAEQAKVIAMSRAIVSKILHVPTSHLRNSEHAVEYASILNELFEL